jgi:DNA-binding GntR family transcriptional regulator
MVDQISRASGVPLHVQIRRSIQADIASGVLPAGARLPTEHEYAKLYGVSIAPVRQALLDLADAGLVVRQKGRGTFVRGDRVEEEIDLLTSFTDGLRRRGVPVRIQVLDRARLPAPAKIAGGLGLRPGASVVHLRRLAWIADDPAVILDAWLPGRQFERLADYDDFDAGRSLYATIEAEFGVRLGLARSRIEVARSLEDESRLLALPEGSPLVRVTSVTEDTVGRLVELAYVTYRADRFVFTMTSLRGPTARPSDSPPDDGQ